MGEIRKITVIKEISSCAPLQAGVGRLTERSTLEIERFAEGSYGTVYRARRIRGNVAMPLIVKLLDPGRQRDPSQNVNTVASLHLALRRDKGKLPNGWEGDLKGLPFWTGQVQLPSGEAFALISYDLHALGFQQLKLVHETQWTSYCGMDLSKRIALAASFARTYAILEKLHFLHGDINKENLFINLTTLETALIDFDSGILRIKGSELPQTLGHADEFVAPELKTATGTDLTRFNEGSELWAVGFMVHVLIFGLHPLFFLKQISLSVITQYLKSNKWPDIDLNSQLYFDGANKGEPFTAYLMYKHRWLRELNRSWPSVFTLLKTFLNKGGIDPSRRPLASMWAETLANRLKPL